MSKKTKLSDAVVRPRAEVLVVIETVAKEKGIDSKEIFNALECALQRAAVEKYGPLLDLHASINMETGEIRVFRTCEVVECVEDAHKQISLLDAKSKDPSLQLGDVYIDILPSVDFNRVAAQSARTIIVEKVREAERRQQYVELKQRIGQIISGIIKRIDNGDIFIEIGRAEAVLRKKDQIPRENFRVGDRIRTLMLTTEPKGLGPVAILSRTHPGFMRRLFEQEVPEIYDGIIEIKAIARDPGSRAKVAIACADTSLDPVGACVGPRGARIQAITTELRGEKIDVVLWSANMATFIVNALSPAEVLKVVVDEDEERYDVVVPDAQLSAAIGRRGQNIRLVRMLTNAKLKIASQSDAIEQQTQERSALVSHFVSALLIDEITAQLLVTEEFESVEQIALIDIEELSELEGVSLGFAQDLQLRAKNYLEAEEQADLATLLELGVQEDIIALGVFDLKTLIRIATEGIKSLEDLATLSLDEFMALQTEDGLSREAAEHLLTSVQACVETDEEENSSA